MKLAEDSGYQLLITADKNILHQNILAGRLIGLLALSTNNWPLMKRHVAAVVQAVNEMQAGEVKEVFCGAFKPRKFRGPKV